MMRSTSIQSAFDTIIPDKERPCTRLLLEELGKQPALTGKKILVNCHLTLATLILVDVLLASDAEVMVTRADDLACHPTALNELKEKDMYIPFADLSAERYTSYFDIVLDCGGYLANVLKPQVAFVELTHVEKEHYANTNCPVISVDDSYIKHIETSFGTGDGFLRAIKKLYIQQGDDHCQKRYLIFGYGKVGRGVCYCLEKSGVPKRNIIVVEVSLKALSMAKSNGHTAFHLLHEQPKIRRSLTYTHCAVTATGIKNAISQHFSCEDFNAVEYLANMGTYDEWGDAFPTTRVLHQKKPLNFMLQFPTRVIYLDPIFALMARVSCQVLGNPPKRILSVVKPKMTLQKEILHTWFKYNDSIRSLEQMQEAVGAEIE